MTATGEDPAGHDRPPMAAKADPPRTLGTHQALIYGSEQELVAAAVPFLAAGVRSGAPTVAVLPAVKRAAVAAGLGADAIWVRWVDAEDHYTFPAHTMRRAADLTQSPGATVESVAGGPGPARLLGEVPFAGRGAREVAEWARFEALINLAFPQAHALCSYDTRILDDAVLGVAARTHPKLAPADAAVPNNDGFQDPAGFAAGIAVPDARPGDHDRRRVGAVRTVRFDRAGGLGAVRSFAAALAVEWGYPERADDVAMAVNEAATNAIEHGGGHGTVHAWTDTTSVWTTSPTGSAPTGSNMIAAAVDGQPRQLVFEVHSPDGPELDPLLGYLAPRSWSRRGRGMWLIRQLTDVVEIRTAGSGSAVRMHVCTAASPRT